MPAGSYLGSSSFSTQLLPRPGVLQPVRTSLRSRPCLRAESAQLCSQAPVQRATLAHASSPNGNGRHARHHEDVHVERHIAAPYAVVPPKLPELPEKEERYEDDTSLLQPENPAPLWPLEHYVEHKEHSRKHRRTVYNFERWAHHRSTQRYAENIKSIPSSRILSSLLSPLLSLTGFSISFCLYQTALETHALPAWLPSFLLSSPEPQVLTSFALSLLLVFRTNSSYGRFDEARKMWAGVVNRCRNIVQQAVVCLPPDDDFSRAAIGRWSVAFSRSLAAHVQEEVDLVDELKDVMLAPELELLMRAQNKPVKCISIMSEVLQQADLSPWQRMQFQLDLTFFYDTLGGCERILKTPIPVSYTRHTCRFLIVWLTALPLGLWEQCGWSVVPITAMIALLLLGIEEIGVQIEEPFGILPLDVICERIESDVRGLLRDCGTVAQFVTQLRADCVADADGLCTVFAHVDGGAAAAPAQTLAAAAASMAAAVSANGAATGSSLAAPRFQVAAGGLRTALIAEDPSQSAPSRNLPIGSRSLR